MTNNDLIKDFVSFAHEKASGIDGKLIVASFGENLPAIVEHFKVGNKEAMTQRIIDLSSHDNRNLYMPLAIMRPSLADGKKGYEKDVVASLGLVADFDNGLGKEYETRSPFTPTFTLETSPGNAQCFYFFDKPAIVSSSSDLHLLKQSAQKLTKACEGSDPVGADLSHVWRIPGTLNWASQKKILKYGRSPDPYLVNFKQPYSSSFVSTSEIAALNFQLTPSVQTDTDKHLSYINPVQLDRLTTNGQDDLSRLIIFGVPEGQRSEAISSVVFQLLKLGHGSGDIVQILLSHPSGIGSKFKGDASRCTTDVLRLLSKYPSMHVTPAEPIDTSFDLEPLGNIDEASLPPREWVLGTSLIKGYVTVLVAPPGVGKSTACLVMATSIATGKNLFNLNVAQEGAVGIINNEDDTDEIQRRMLAIRKHFKIPPADLDGKFFIRSGQDKTFLIAKRAHDKRTLISHHKDALIQFCKSKKLVALFIDPFLETHDANENDNREINDVVKLYREIAQQANVAIVLVHHTRKQQGQSSTGNAGNMDSGRGASSLIGAARSVITLYDLSEADATEYGIAPDQRHLYVRMDDAKANLSLKSNQPNIYRKHSVNLMNGDTVGILLPAYDTFTAIPPRSTSEISKLLAAVGSHSAFEAFRLSGIISREKFLSAMIASKAFLGTPSTKRPTLQGRTDKYLLGQSLSEHGITLSSRKINGRIFMYATLDMPENAGTSPARLKDKDKLSFLPEPAQKARHFEANTLKSNHAGMPP